MTGKKTEFVRKTESELRTAYADLNRKAKEVGLSPKKMAHIRMLMIEAKAQIGLDFTLIIHLLAQIIGLEEILDHIKKCGLDD